MRYFIIGKFYGVLAKSCAQVVSLSRERPPFFFFSAEQESLDWSVSPLRYRTYNKTPSSLTFCLLCLHPQFGKIISSIFLSSTISFCNFPLSPFATWEYHFFHFRSSFLPFWFLPHFFHSQYDNHLLLVGSEAHFSELKDKFLVWIKNGSVNHILLCCNYCSLS